VSSDKTERLINLTLGLLSSKRYLTKNEIFKNIAGYSGSPETMERMFERDKDELRSLGIEIEVGQLDPLFEDEQGYLIKSANIQIQPNDFSKEEILFMMMAGNLWRESALANLSENALIKVASLDGGIGFNSIALPLINDEDFNFVLFEKIIDAMLNSKYISFTYKDRTRVVAPMGLKNVHGFWYLIGQEGDEDIKIYKLIRIQSDIKFDASHKQFPRPANFDLNTYLQSNLNGSVRTAFLKIREDRVNALRNRGEVTKVGEGWDLLEVPFEDLAEFSTEILWYGDDVYVQAPEDLRADVVSKLKLVANG
jgi:proteasome accessory factor B